MAKKRDGIPRRTDADRRARQGERLSRHLRVLHCILGPDRWDAGGLSKELEVSPRTIHRIMQTLAMANVPWYFCKKDECYRVRPGFRFPGLDKELVPAPERPGAGKLELLALLRDFGELMKKTQEVIEKLVPHLQ